MNAAIYARVSSEKQDVDLSISAQLKSLRDYASKNGYVVIKEFVDEAESGKTSARPEFKQMIAMARRQPKPFNAILIWKYSRFARNREDSIVFKTMLRKNGVDVISITEPVDNTPHGKLMEAIIESMDEFYSQNLGEEVTRGMRESASRGFYMASNTPYGYRKVKVKDGNKERAKLEPNPHKAEVVSRLFREVLHGKGLKEALQELNHEGIAGPRGKGWGKTTIYKILTNETYTGTLVWGTNSARNLPPVRVDDAWPAIVDKDTFPKVQDLLRSRSFIKMHPQRVSSHYLLSGLVTCGHCGKAMVGQDAKAGKFTYYVCGTLLKKGAGSCPSHYLNSRRFESLVIEKIKEHILTEGNLRELVRMVNEQMDAAASEYRYKLETVQEEISDVDRRLGRLYDAIETGKLNLEDLSSRIKQLKGRKEQLEARKWELEWQLKERKVELADMETVTRYVEDLRKLLDESGIAERKSFIKSFVKEIVVTGDNVLLRYKIPMTKEGLVEENLGVPHIVHYGGR
jgi:site-specific DNA recombinase